VPLIETHLGSMLDWLADYDGPLFDCCVTDPPYELGFMGKSWDSTGIAFQVETWRRVYDALKPGAHLVAFSGTRTYHRMACAIEDAGFEIRDQLAWCYGSGFPKSHDVSKAIDKAAGAEREVVGEYDRRGQHDGCNRNSGAGGEHDMRAHVGAIVPITAPATPEAQQWQGWGSALKPAWEPICLARKPLAEKSIAANVLAHGTGAINVDACRVGLGADKTPAPKSRNSSEPWFTTASQNLGGDDTKARFPANLVHDGSDEVLAGFPETSSGSISPHHKRTTSKTANTFGERAAPPEETHGDSGSAARFFYSAKAGPLDRIGTAHATVKPVDLMRWLVRLVTPPGGRILEPFAGSGTTGIAAMAEGFDCTMIELVPEHLTDIDRKLAFLRGEGGAGMIERHKARIERTKPDSAGPLFDMGSDNG
jgi:site-specific DNA-methyltransferase (adenine-specific)